jgi:hypothetical protein
MSKLLTLNDWPLPTVRLSCRVCGQELELEREVLLALYGEAQELFALREELAAHHCGQTKSNEVCSAILTDALLVQAIFEPDASQVLKPELLPQAREWRARLGIVVNEITTQGQAA